MKKILIAAVVALVAMASANAQVASGLISFFSPGLGQIMAGEVGRGFIFVGAEAITYSICRTAGMSLKLSF